MSVEIGIILLLLLLNGAFAMAEMAVIAAKRSRLEAQAEKGSKAARFALMLAEEPSQFLSTVQIGITLVGIVAGVYGGATIALDLESFIRAAFPALARYAYPISYGLVVVFITYLSLIVGEIVPKRLALAFPEKLAVGLTPLLRLTLALLKPFVFLLELSTKCALRVLPLKLPEEQAVTEEDVRSLIEQRAEQGVIESESSTILARALRLSERTVQSIMTHRIDFVWIDIEDSEEQIWQVVTSSPHSHFPARQGSSDVFLGILSLKDLAVWRLQHPKKPLSSLITQPTTLYPGLSILETLRRFRAEKCHSAVVIDEHGTIDGIVTTHDLLEAIVGELPDSKEQPTISRREDGSMLTDGWLNVDELTDHLDLPRGSLSGDKSFSSVGGFMMWKLSHVPKEGDAVEAENYRFEVVDMDRHRVDKVLISPIPKSGHREESAE